MSQGNGFLVVTIFRKIEDFDEIGKVHGILQKGLSASFTFGCLIQLIQSEHYARSRDKFSRLFIPSLRTQSLERRTLLSSDCGLEQTEVSTSSSRLKNSPALAPSLARERENRDDGAKIGHYLRVKLFFYKKVSIK